MKKGRPARRETETDASASHRRRIVHEFTCRAEAFATAPALTSVESLSLLVRLSKACAQDTMLDVACGAGAIVCAFAENVRSASGIDLTPAMIQRAKLMQKQKGLTNVSWQVGDVMSLPYPDETFSIVTCRYALHHMEQPSTVLGEMARVLVPGGRMVLADVYAPENPTQAAIFNRMERLRDPSHVRAMSIMELEELLGKCGLLHSESATYRLEFSEEVLVRESVADAEAIRLFRQLLAQQAVSDSKAIDVRRSESGEWLSYPIVVLVAEKPLLQRAP